MSPFCSRRLFLQLSGAGLLVFASGCSTSSSTGTVTIGLINSTEQPRTVYVEIRRTGTVDWSQDIEVPSDRSDHPTPTVEAEPVLTDIAEGTQLIMEAWLDDRPDVASQPLAIKDADEDLEEYVTIRVWGQNDARVDISSSPP